MTEVHSSIAAFAPQNEQLLGVLRQTDYAEASLAQQQSYVKDLETELARLVKDIRDYEIKTAMEKTEFEKYRDSNIKRFTSKLGGSKGREKFQSRTEKEEREYYEALEKERAAKDRKVSLDQALREALATRDTYQRDNDTHVRAQKDLDDLYNMLFSGPTPAFPQEDQSEWQYTRVRERFNGVEQRYRTMWQACDMLNESRKHISLANQQMMEARDYSRMDMFGGGHMADMAERSALSKAESEANQVKMLVNHAVRTFPEGVKPLPHFEVASGNIMGDMLFDNIFSDMDFHDKIKRSQQQIVQVEENLKVQFENLNQQLEAQKQTLDLEQEELTNARRQLQDMRTQIFTQVSGQQPPAYQA